MASETVEELAEEPAAEGAALEVGAPAQAGGEAGVFFLPGTVEERRPLSPEQERTTMELNLGPQHPSTHGVFRCILTLDGETIVDCEPVIGYLHRNHEKLYEGMQYPQIIPMTDRTDYLSAITCELPYVLCVEKALGIEVPERAQYLRVIFAEFQRMLSHQLYFGTFGMDIGAVTPFLLALRDREFAFDLMDRATGARLLYNYLRIGGVRNDVSAAWLQDLERYVDYIEREAWPEYMRLLMENEIFRIRTEGIGIISPEMAVAYGASGPVLRASGVRWDIRKDDPYCIYDRFEFDVPVGERGDARDRCLVRMYEIRESIRIIRQALRQIPDGPVLGKVPKGILRLPKGDYYQHVDSPRGEVGVYIVSDGGPTPYRVKWRSPAFVHLQLLPHIVRGEKVADFIALTATLDPVFGEVDR